MDLRYTQIDQEDEKNSNTLLIDPIKYEKDCLNIFVNNENKLVQEATEKFKNYLNSKENEFTLLLPFHYLRHSRTILNALLTIILDTNQYFNAQFFSGEYCLVPNFIKKLFNVMDKVVFTRKDKDTYLSLVNSLLKNNIEQGKKEKIKSSCIVHKHELVYDLNYHIKFVLLEHNLKLCLKDTGYHIKSKVTNHFGLSMHFTLNVCTSNHEHKNEDYKSCHDMNNCSIMALIKN